MLLHWLLGNKKIEIWFRVQQYSNYCTLKADFYFMTLFCVKFGRNKEELYLIFKRGIKRFDKLRNISYLWTKWYLLPIVFSQKTYQNLENIIKFHLLWQKRTNSEKLYGGPWVREHVNIINILESSGVQGRWIYFKSDSSLIDKIIKHDIYKVCYFIINYSFKYVN